MGTGVGGGWKRSPAADKRHSIKRVNGRPAGPKRTPERLTEGGGGVGQISAKVTSRETKGTAPKQGHRQSVRRGNSKEQRSNNDGKNGNKGDETPLPPPLFILFFSPF